MDRPSLVQTVHHLGGEGKTHLGGVDTFNRPTEKASPICDTPPASVPSSRMTIPN